MSKQLFFLGFLACLSPLCSEIQVTVSKEKLSQDDSFTAEFHLPGMPHVQPDFSSLQKDFIILSQSQSHSRTIINGRHSAQTNWSVILRPKNEGFLTVPPIYFGNDYSIPKTVEVHKKYAAKQDESLFLETELIAPSNVYEQTPLVYIVRLYRSINLARAALSPVSTSDKDALIEPIGKERDYEIRHSNGKRYAVLERKYAIAPQNAGELTIHPIVFEGEIIKDMGSFFNVQTEFKRLSSKEKKVHVKHIPAPFNKRTWFPADAVKLSEQWSGDLSNVFVGEPITWTLDIQAEGTIANQIPDLEIDVPNSFKQYVDKAELNNVTTQNSTVGSRKFKIALIPTKSGAITLPEINITWWNQKLDQPQVAKLPARTIHVQENAVAMAQPQDTQVNTSNALNEEILNQDITSKQLPMWVYALILLNAVWVIKYVTSRFKMPAFLTKARFKTAPKTSSLLQKACLANDAKKAEIYLLEWCRELNPGIQFLNLHTIKEHIPHLAEVIDELNAYLYNAGRSWQGAKLWKEVKSLKPVASKKASTLDGLSELYPQ